MAQPLTRRGLVAAATAAIVAAAEIGSAADPVSGRRPVAAENRSTAESFTQKLIPGADPDAELLALRGPYDLTLAGMDAVNPAHSRAEEAYLAALKAHPERDEAVLARATGFDRAERAWLHAVDANSEVIAQITEQPAHTLEGLIFKARVAEADCFNRDLTASIVADLIAMGGTNA